MESQKRIEIKIDSKLASSILREVNYLNAFFFFIDFGRYSDKYAVDLADFCQKIKRIDVRSVDFHFKRKDFSKWIKGTLGDAKLAYQINRIRGLKGEALRAQIHKIVTERLNELRKIQASEETYVEKI